MKYEPILDLIRYAEGTSRKRTPKAEGYNTTLSYGAFTGGRVNLTRMNLREIDNLQTRMLRHPKNRWNSSAIGAYQIVRTTLRKIKQKLGVSGDQLFDEAFQDRCALFLLGGRGVDKWLAGRMSDKQILLNLAKEWASFPTASGRGYYSNQKNTPITPQQVLDTLKKVREADEYSPDQPVRRDGGFMELLRALFRVFFVR